MRMELLMWWAMKHQYFGTITSLKELELRVKQHNKSRKEVKKQQKKLKKGVKTNPDALKEFEANLEPTRKMNLAHNKWLAFGGGFYGVVALWTYIHVEVGEIRDFLYNLGGFFAMFSNISIDLIIDLIINSLMNFVWAIAWPGYWIGAIESGDAWVWVIAAYLGYRLGFKLAMRVHNKTSGVDSHLDHDD